MCKGGPASAPAAKRYVRLEMRNDIKVTVAMGAFLVAGLSSASSAAKPAELACIDKVGSSQEVRCGGQAKPSRLTVEMDPQFASLPPVAQEELLQLHGGTQGLLRFYSAYGEFKACLLCIEPERPPFVVLTTTYNHGTNVRRKRMAIYSAEGEFVEPVFTAPVFGFFGYGSWSYRTEFTDFNGDGLIDLRLVLEHDRIEDSKANDPSLIPRVKMVEYIFNRRINSFELSGIQEK